MGALQGAPFLFLARIYFWAVHWQRAAWRRIFAPLEADTETEPLRNQEVVFVSIID
jgi:hypothetical protein